MPCYNLSLPCREEVLNVLLDIDYTLQSEAFVGTLTSNFGRLLDSLRSTVGCRANRPLLDAIYGPYPLEHIECRRGGGCVF